MIREYIERLFWKYFEFDKIKGFDSLDVDAVYVGLAKDELFREYLKYILANDKDRYFRVSKDFERAYIKGEMTRTLYILRQMDKKRATTVDNKIKTFKNGRYKI